MIQILRTIRRKLLSEGKTGKYLKYAIGEIFLVVIGILIALQVNTWNQNRQKRELEKSILLEIQKNLNEDLYEIESDIGGFQFIIEVDSILIHHFQAQNPYNDSIGALIHIAQMSPHFTPLRSGYKFLESKGIGVISDNSLRMLITDLYEWDFPYYNIYANERFNTVESIIQPYWAKHFYLEEHHEFYHFKRVPMNYNALLKDSEFISLLQTSLHQAKVMKGKAENLKTQIETVQNNIKLYLKSSFGIGVLKSNE